MPKKRIAFASWLLVFCAATGAANPRVTKVEPPNWWPDHTLNPVRVLVRGSELQGAAVSAAPGFLVSNVRTNKTGTYLFVDLNIAPGLSPGKYPLTIQTAAGTVEAPFGLERPLAPEGRFQGFSADDVIYLIMPDRFANGDPSNDDPAIAHGLFDRKRSRFYHGGDLAGILDHLPYLKSLGVTALWITPVYDNSNRPNWQQAVNGQAIADYHGYGAVDYYGFDEHLGSMDVLRKLVDSAHARGLKIIQDQVANHVGPAHPWVTDPPEPDWFHGTAAHHVDETWQIWTLPDPHAAPKVRRDVLDGWFMNVLPDMNQENPDVAQYEIENALWWVGMAGFDGIRQDTLPYVPRAFWHEWSAALKRQYPKLRAVGEVFDPDPAVPSFFQGAVPQWDGIDSGIDSVFDFPVYFKLREVFARNATDLTAMSRAFAQDRLYADPYTLVTFLGNHDVMRFMSEPGATPEKLKLAFTVLLTARGIPAVYSGDEIGMLGGADPDNRRDFPGGWKGDQRNAFEASERTPQENGVWNYLHQLTTIRARSEALRRGTMTELALTPKTWVYARQSDDAIAIVVINNDAQAAEVAVPFSSDGTYRSQLGVGPELAIHSGRGVVRIPARAAEIYETSPPRL